MGNGLQAVNDADQLSDLIRIDPEVWFSTFGMMETNAVRTLNRYEYFAEADVRSLPKMPDRRPSL